MLSTQVLVQGDGEKPRKATTNFFTTRMLLGNDQKRCLVSGKQCSNNAECCSSICVQTRHRCSWQLW
nr:conotoxin precursor O2 [Conus ebraeus]